MVVKSVGSRVLRTAYESAKMPGLSPVRVPTPCDDMIIDLLSSNHQPGNQCLNNAGR